MGATEPRLGCGGADCWRASNRYDVAAVLLFGTLIALVAFTFGDYAISNDEEVQQRYGEMIIAYYASGFADQALFHFRNLYLYGGLFDVVAVGMEKLHSARSLRSPAHADGALRRRRHRRSMGDGAYHRRVARRAFGGGWRLRCAAPGTARCSTIPRTSRSPPP